MKTLFLLLAFLPLMASAAPTATPTPALIISHRNAMTGQKVLINTATAHLTTFQGLSGVIVSSNGTEAVVKFWFPPLNAFIFKVFQLENLESIK